jgi:exodeoxyribonuclease X
MDVDVLGAARVAALGLDVTTGDPPLIFQVAVYQVEGGAITASPLCFWAEPAAPLAQIRTSAWPSVRLAPRWPEVAERVKVAVADRILAVHDVACWDVLARHLPDWQPIGMIRTRDLAEQTWPGLSDYGLSLPGVKPGRGGRALVEAHRVALLLGALRDQAGRPHRLAGSGSTTGPVRGVTCDDAPQGGRLAGF